MSTVLLFLSVECALFSSAALMHAGIFGHGHEHGKAATAESVIAGALMLALVLSLITPRSSRGIGLGAQGFALLGTFVGILTIAIGIGPRTPLDLMLHAIMVLLLVSGLLVVARARATGGPGA